jgi:hypothetical protein
VVPFELLHGGETGVGSRHSSTPRSSCTSSACPSGSRWLIWNTRNG